MEFEGHCAQKKGFWVRSAGGIIRQSLEMAFIVERRNLARHADHKTRRHRHYTPSNTELAGKYSCATPPFHCQQRSLLGRELPDDDDIHPCNSALVQPAHCRCSCDVCLVKAYLMLSLGRIPCEYWLVRDTTRYIYNRYCNSIPLLGFALVQNGLSFSLENIIIQPSLVPKC